MKISHINLAAAILFFTSFSVNAQSNTTKTESVKPVTKISETKTSTTKVESTNQRAEAKQEIKLLNEIPTTREAVTTAKSRPIIPRDGNKRVSEYMSQEKVIMARTIAGDIPASFPKHVEGQTKEEYRVIMKAWAKNNLNLIKKEYHAKVLEKAAPIKN